MASLLSLNLFKNKHTILCLVSNRKPIQPHLFVQRRELKNRIFFKRFLPTGSIPECPVQWKLPEKTPFNDPSITGDGKKFHPPIDMTQHPDIVKNSKELVVANEMVSKMFNFEFLGRKHAMIQIRNDMVKSVRNHNYDNESTEVQIALATAIIRNLNEHLEGRLPKPRFIHNYLNKLISKRKKRLIKLRKWDYKRFEWLLEKLDLYYTPHLEHKYELTRKNSIRQVTEQYIQDYKERILEEYHANLNDQKEEFLIHKLKMLKWMRQEELECGIEPTITEEMIEESHKKLLEHQEMLSKIVIVEDKSANILSDL